MKNCLYCGRIINPPKIKFCSNKHKDKYHNETNPRGKFAHLNPNNHNYMEDELEHPFSMEGTNWGGAKD